MHGEISRVQDPDDSNSFFVQRLKNGAVETLRETVHTIGEITDKEDDLLTVETITITRRIGSKIQF